MADLQDSSVEESKEEPISKIINPKPILKTTFVSLWDNVNVVPLLTGIKLVPGTAEHFQYSTAPTSYHSQDHCASGLPLFLPSKPSSLNEIKCPYCQVNFNCREDQVAHYHLDYHKANLKRSLAGKPPITEDQFLNEISDVSSISGSESEEDNDEDKDNNGKILRKQTKVFFLNSDGEVVSLYRSILESKKCEISGEGELVQRALMASRRLNWVIILMGGGHFAAAVFNGSEIIIHKTFHSYTVRSKQGGAQSGRDNKSATSHPRSAGASLRRYNEQSHTQHVQELLESWRVYLEKANLILLRAPSRSKHILFGGRTPYLFGTDARIRTVPFSTRRPTFSEVKRVHGVLTQIEVHGTENIFMEAMKEKEFMEAQAKREATPPRKPVPTKPRKNQRTRKSSKSEESAIDTANLNADMEAENSQSDQDELSQLLYSTEIIDVGSRLECFGSSIEDEWKQKRRKTPKKKKKSESNDNGTNKNEKQNDEVQILLYTCCKTNDISTMENILQAHQILNSEEENTTDNLSPKVLESLSNYETIEDIITLKFAAHQNKGLLHIASENGQKELLWWLLDHGCDPAIPDKKKQLPYNLSQDKDTRNTYRRFMAKYPEKYDYKTANVPSPLTAADEEAQALKRQSQRKAKKEKEKEKKKKNLVIQQEEQERINEELEKKRFLALSDREKRAIAAERRLMQTGTQTKGLSRCFQCGMDISGKVPYEYKDYKFCSTKCVRAHRNLNV